MQNSATLAHDQTHPSTGPFPLRVYLITPHALERAGLRALLERSGDARVVLELSSVAVLPHGAGVERPNVVLLDVGGEQVGVQAVRDACEAWKGVPVLALVDRCEFTLARSLILAGARGVVTKDESAEHFVSAIHKVQEHELWLDRASVARLVDELAAEHEALEPHERDPRLRDLTGRELEIVALVAKGLCNKSIASALDISDNTVRHHLTSIFAKLGVHDRLSLAVFAFRHQLG